MSRHDFFLVGVSVVATLALFSSVSRYFLAPPLRAVFKIDLGPTKNVSSVAELFPMLTPEECRYLEGQKWAIPRLTVHRFQHHATIKVVYALGDSTITEERESIITNPYPCTLWSVEVGEREKGLVGLLNEPKLEIQYDRSWGQHSIVVGFVGGRFHKGMMGVPLEENVLARVPLSASALRKLRDKDSIELEKDTPWERHQFIVMRNERLRWAVECKDVERLVSRWGST